MEFWKHIEKRSVGLKSLSNSERGLWAELVVLRLLNEKQVKIISHRKKYPFGEIDIVGFHKETYLLFEVKYLDNEWRIFERIKLAQLKKIKNNLLYFTSRSKNAKAYLVFVSSEARCNFVDINS